MHKKISLLLCSFILLTGCTAQQEILDDINLVTLVGFETVDGKTQGTAVFPEFLPDGSIQTKSYTAVGKIGKEIGQKLNLQVQNPMANGKIEMVLFGSEFAKKGIIETSDIFRRDSSISANLTFAVFDGNVHDLLVNYSIPNKDLGLYLTKMIDQNSKQETIPRTNIHLFFRSYFTDGKDAFLPLLGMEDEEVGLVGLGLFQKGNLVGELPADQLPLFTLLHNGFNNGSLIVPISKLESEVSLGHIEAEPKIEIKGTSRAPEITYNIKMKGIINEYSGNLKGIEKKVKMLEKSIDKTLKKRAENLIKSLQSQNLDPLGIGKSANAHFRDWDEEQWEEIYSSLNIKVNIHTNILESGVIR